MENFVYLFADDAGRGFLVDPAFEVDRVLGEARRLGVEVTHVLATHGHADHVQGIPDVKRVTGATVVAHAGADHPFDRGVEDGEVFSVGDIDVKVVHTPGHRFDSVCYVVNDTHLLTGDTLFVGECGRVDLPGSDVEEMFETLVHRIPKLSGELVVCPGHDYGPKPLSTLHEEMHANYTLKPRTKEEFLRFMAEP